MRLIDADAACEKCGAKEIYDCSDECLIFMGNLPTIEAEAVRHGGWGKVYRSKVTVTDGYVSSCCDMWNERKSSYCPHCGARMDGGAK